MLMRYSPAYLIADLELMRVSVSRASSFNDPFELHLKPSSGISRSEAKRLYEEVKHSPKVRERELRANPGMTQKQLRKKLLEYRNTWIDKHIAKQPEMIKHRRADALEGLDRLGRIMCFARVAPNSPFEIPMWAYYADSHNGVRFAMAEQFFTRKDFSLLEMQYVETPPILPLGKHPSSLEYNTFLESLLRCKGIGWEHEREARLLIPVERTKKQKGSDGGERDYVSLQPDDILRIDLGVRLVSPAFIKRILALKEIYPRLRVYRGIKSEEAYAVDYIEIQGDM